MATNLSVDPKLIEQALRVGGEKTKAATVTKALEEFIARCQQRAMLELAGKLEWEDGFDHKKDRAVGFVLRNECRRQGVQSGTIDALIAHLCMRHDLLLLTTDADFTHLAKHCTLQCGASNSKASRADGLVLSLVMEHTNFHWCALSPGRSIR